MHKLLGEGKDRDAHQQDKQAGQQHLRKGECAHQAIEHTEKEENGGKQHSEQFSNGRADPLWFVAVGTGLRVRREGSAAPGAIVMVLPKLCAAMLTDLFGGGFSAAVGTICHIGSSFNHRVIKTCYHTQSEKASLGM